MWQGLRQRTQLTGNIRLRDGASENELIAMRTAGAATLPMPRMILRQCR